MFVIDSMVNRDWDKTIATMSVVLLDHKGSHILTINDCRLVNGAKGIFVSGPSKKVEPFTDKNGNQKEYYNLIFFGDAHRDELNQVAEQHYDPSGNYPQDKAKATATATASLPA